MNSVMAIGVAALVAFGFSHSTMQVNSEVSDRRADDEAIRSINAATTEAFTLHDAKAWVRYCTPDARLITVRGESMTGVAEIEQGLTSIFQTRGRGATLKTLDVSVRFLRRDVALAYVTNELSGLVGPDGQNLPSHRELSIRVFVKDSAVWKITAFHNTRLAPSTD